MTAFILLDRRNEEQFIMTLDQIAAATGVDAATVEWAIATDGAFVNADWLAVCCQGTQAQIDAVGSGFASWSDQALAHLAADDLGKRYDEALANAQAQAEADQLYFELQELRDLAAALYRTTGSEEWLTTAADFNNAFLATRAVSHLADTTGHEEQVVMDIVDQLLAE